MAGFLDHKVKFVLFCQYSHFGMSVCYGWIIVFAALVSVTCGQREGPTTESEEPWTGRWMPHPPDIESTSKKPEDLHDPKHGVKMGVIAKNCDDAKTNLTLDWDMSPYYYTCYSPLDKFVPNFRLKPILECENIPKHYVAHHECMNNTVEYDRPIPTLLYSFFGAKQMLNLLKIFWHLWCFKGCGTHRPLWPRYGEYKYVPRQRWLHNLEHGAVVMLYHPCVNPFEVKMLKKLVTSCLRRHIITPIPLLDPQRPLALVTWGCRLTMSAVDPKIVATFIKNHALRGPEKYAKDGQYDLGLEVPAEIVSDFDDSELCPKR
ncbi:hypothetical protein L9F63_019040 [Diploptera punctata]|uniref:Uncharacterized protein n=1 Tax=Diploptera punctata TaxID=6984 RepID=A0AAD7ZW15_DIPPU|nr:hypothetical protein L9F63_019040 [Diploptera punctata]